jgi:hypothetical protein
MAVQYNSWIIPAAPGYAESEVAMGQRLVFTLVYEYVGNSGKLKQVMFCSVGLHKEEELSALKKRMKTAGMHTLDMTNSDLAKDHLRHLVSFSLKPAGASLFTSFFMLCKNFLLQLFLWCRKTQIWNGFINAADGRTNTGGS